jgi:hypothetical protein
VVTPSLTGSERADRRRQSAMPVAARVALVLVSGLAVGAVTSVLQKDLSAPWLSLVNAASP